MYSVRFANGATGLQGLERYASRVARFAILSTVSIAVLVFSVLICWTVLRVSF
jgi:hypothetical protein